MKKRILSLLLAIACAASLLTGCGFQYLCNILDTDFLNTIDGHTWQREYLNGTSNVANSPEMQKAFAVLDKWKELGDAE